MKKLIMAVVAGYAGFLVHNADATPLTLTSKIVDNGWEKVRMNCDQFGRCWKERNRNALLDSYNHAPPPLPSRERADETRVVTPAGRIRMSLW